jgi:hypothetical protein
MLALSNICSNYTSLHKFLSRQETGLFGTPGSSESTLAERLANKLGFDFIETVLVAPKALV